MSLCTFTPTCVLLGLRSGHAALALFALALAGCVSLARVAPDLLRNDAGSIQFPTANGRNLSPERSHSLVERLVGVGEQGDIVKLNERRGALLHAKTGLIDGVRSTVGSTNLDWRSFLHNQELSAVVLGPELGAKMRLAFDRDPAASDAITFAVWEHRSVATRVKEMFARVWEYWL